MAAALTAFIIISQGGGGSTASTGDAISDNSELEKLDLELTSGEVL